MHDFLLKPETSAYTASSVFGFFFSCFHYCLNLSSLPVIYCYYFLKHEGDLRKAPPALQKSRQTRATISWVTGWSYKICSCCIKIKQTASCLTTWKIIQGSQKVFIIWLAREHVSRLSWSKVIFMLFLCRLCEFMLSTSLKNLGCFEIRGMFRW